MPAAYMPSIFPFTKRAWRGGRRGRKLDISLSADRPRRARKLDIRCSANRSGRHTCLTHPKSIHYILSECPGPAASGTHPLASPASSVRGVTARGALSRCQRAACPRCMPCKVDIRASAERFTSGTFILGIPRRTGTGACGVTWQRCAAHSTGRGGAFELRVHIWSLAITLFSDSKYTLSAPTWKLCLRANMKRTSHGARGTFRYHCTMLIPRRPTRFLEFPVTRVLDIPKATFEVFENTPCAHHIKAEADTPRGEWQKMVQTSRLQVHSKSDCTKSRLRCSLDSLHAVEIVMVHP